MAGVTSALAMVHAAMADRSSNALGAMAAAIMATVLLNTGCRGGPAFISFVRSSRGIEWGLGVPRRVLQLRQPQPCHQGMHMPRQGEYGTSWPRYAKPGWHNCSSEVRASSGTHAQSSPRCFWTGEPPRAPRPPLPLPLHCVSHCAQHHCYCMRPVRATAASTIASRTGALVTPPVTSDSWRPYDRSWSLTFSR